MKIYGSTKKFETSLSLPELSAETCENKLPSTYCIHHSRQQQEQHNSVSHFWFHSLISPIGQESARPQLPPRLYGSPAFHRFTMVSAKCSSTTAAEDRKTLLSGNTTHGYLHACARCHIKDMDPYIWPMSFSLTSARSLMEMKLPPLFVGRLCDFHSCVNV